MAYYNGQKVFQVAYFGPYIHSIGENSAVLITTDPDRENISRGAFSVIGAGSRNVIGEKASESFVSGGLNVQNGQDGFMFGYRGLSEANQSLTGGYRCTNRASESIQVGERLTMDGTITYDEDGNPKSDSRYNAQFGQNSTMGVGTLNCFMSGQGHTQGAWCKWDRVGGFGHSIGHHVECIDVDGYENVVENYITDSTIRGYNQKARNRNGSSSNKKYDIYLFGHDCTNRDANGTDHSNIYLFGKGLRPVEDDQTIVGAYNAGTEHCWFEVGCGTSNARKTAFAVCQQGNDYWIEMNGKAVIPPAPASDGTYSLKLVIAGGAKTYSWETA